MYRIKLHPENPKKRDVQHIADLLREGAVMIFPTDTVYAIGCLMTNRDGIDRIIRITGKKEKHTKLSLICSDISTASDYAANLDNKIFKVMKKALPGPYTFILQSSKELQKSLKVKRKEIGIRIPDNIIVRDLLEAVGQPLISTSLTREDEIEPYFLDPEEIYDTFLHEADIFIDQGYGSHIESTVIDFTGGTIDIIREGKGDISFI